MRIMIGPKRTLTIPKRLAGDLDEHTVFEITPRADGVIELNPTDAGLIELEKLFVRYLDLLQESPEMIFKPTEQLKF